MVEGVTYTQEIDEKTGAIKYVPSTPPTPPEGADGEGDGEGEGEGKIQPTGKHGGTPTYGHNSDVNEIFTDLIDHTSFKENTKMTELIQRLEDNNKRLRYDNRLANGKLDGRRLTAYKTSDKLFKKKAIKHKDYQFTIMLDTSGSMLGDEHDDIDRDNHHKASKLHIGIESIAQTVKALEALHIPVSVVAMNYKVTLLKQFNEKWDDKSFGKRLQFNVVANTSQGIGSQGGTDEAVAYTETLKYIAEHSVPTTNNVVIVLSDGAPNSSGGMVDCAFEGDMYQVESRSSRTDELRSFWEHQTQVTPYGIGLLSDARQLPRSQRLNHIDKLPDVMSNLIQEILL